MNAFMLYRKAYQNLAKVLCTQNNHQVVSQVCGDGWPLEPEAVRAQFNEWARIERENHQRAHPKYKFTPSKPARKSKRMENESDDGSVLADPDRIPGRAAQVSGKRANNRREEPVGPGRRTFVHFRVVPCLRFSERTRVPVFEMGKPMPSPYDNTGLVGSHYYQQTIHPTPGRGAGVENIMIRETPSPASYGGAEQAQDVYDDRPS